MKKHIFFFAFFSIANLSYASSPVTTNIEWVAQRGNGNIMIKFTQVIEETDCANREIEIENSNPSKDGFLSIALSAYMADKSVVVTTDGCNSLGTPTISNTGSILIEPKS